MSIRLITSSEVVSHLMYTILIVFCDVGGYAIALYVTCWVTKSLTYDIILGMDWLKSTNPVIDWVACSLELTVGAN